MGYSPWGRKSQTQLSEHASMPRQSASFPQQYEKVSAFLWLALAVPFGLVPAYWVILRSVCAWQCKRTSNMLDVLRILQTLGVNYLEN